MWHRWLAHVEASVVGLTDANERRLGRTLVWTAVALVAWGPGFAGFYLWLEQYTMAALVVGACAAALSVPWILARHRSVRLATHTLVGALAIVLFGTAARTGGPTSPALLWVPAIPLLARMVGRVEAVIWLGINTAFFLGIGIWDRVAPMQTALTHGQQDAYWFACALSSGILILSLTGVYDREADALRAELDRGRLAVQASLRGARLVLDNVHDGLVVLGRDGRVGSDWSTALSELLGPIHAGEPVWAILSRVDPDVGAFYELGWEAFLEEVFPPELAAEQLPRRLTREGRVLDLRLRPLGGDLAFEGAVLVVSDITDAVGRERAEQAQAELLAGFRHIRRDPTGFMDFLAEGDAIVSRLLETADRTQAAREIHTLKGNASLFDLASVVAACHAAEGALHGGEDLTEARAGVVGAWRQTRDRLAELLPSRAAAGPTATQHEVSELVHAARNGASSVWIADQVEAWAWDRAARRLEHLGESAASLAERLGKPGLQVSIDATGLRTRPETLAGFWSAMAHVIRNAVDHGIEAPDERLAAGKSEQGHLRLSGRLEASGLVVRITDDGRGVDWESLRARARRLGLPAETPQDLTAALFADGVSTRDEVSLVSGRGIGMSAVREALGHLGGTVEVLSTPGAGTTFVFRLPARLGRQLSGPTPLFDQTRPTVSRQT